MLDELGAAIVCSVCHEVTSGFKPMPITSDQLLEALSYFRRN